MKIKITVISTFAIIFAAGCATDGGSKKSFIGSDSVKADVLASYYNLEGHSGAVYFTKQKHFYDVNGLKLKVKASEPQGDYEMTFSSSSVSFSNKNAAIFWNAPTTKLLTWAFSLSGGYETPQSLDFDKTDEAVRIQGILYNVYTKNVSSCEIKIFTRLANGAADRMQITCGKDTYSAFCYNGFYEAGVERVVSHNIDIYAGAAASIDTKLVYSAKYTGF